MAQNTTAALKQLTSKRGQIKAKVTRFQTYLDNSFAYSDGIDELSKRVQKIELVWDEFDNCQSEIELLDENAVQSNDRAEFENFYFLLTARAQKIMNEYNSVSSSATTGSAGASDGSPMVAKRVNLPLLNLPKFSGNYSEYTHFRDMFNSLIDRNESLDNVQRFHYLVSSLHGEALHLVQSLQITDSNYKIAWDSLKDRYENKRAIINNHLKSIFGLPTLHKENLTALRSFVDSFQKDFRSLKNLGEPVDTWDTILIHVLNSKLDFSSKREWETNIKSDAMPTLVEFMKFLNTRCQLLETLYSSSVNDRDQSRKITYQFRKGNDGKSLNHISAEALMKCFLCQGQHRLFQCTEFLELNPQNRFAAIRRLNLCQNCFRPYSKSHKCNGRCKRCGKPHNTLLHRDAQDPSSKPVINNASSTSSKQSDNDSKEGAADEKRMCPSNLNTKTHHSHVNEPFVLLATANVFIFDKNQEPVKCRALLDSGSQSNFITSDLVNKLQLKPSRIKLPVAGIGEVETSVNQRVKTTIQAMHSAYSEQLSFLVLESITGCIPAFSFDISRLKIPQGIALADADFNKRNKVDILLGASTFYKVLSSGQITLGKGNPILRNSRLGWIIGGTMQTRVNRHTDQQCLLGITEVQEQLERFWAIEDTPNIPETVLFTRDEQLCENEFVSNHTQDDTGRFTVSLPLRDNYQNLGDSLKMAKDRFMGLERKLQRNAQLRELYTKFMEEYEGLGHMSRLTESQINTENVIYYMPHHGVMNPDSTTTKLRVVFDASAKSSTGLSLNDVLYVGPTIQDDLFSILLRFRKHTYVLKGDITKMYRQVNITKEQRNLQRILWRSDPNQELSHYVLNTVTYGTATAPFLAIRSLHQTAINHMTTHPEASRVILKDFYVDDLITGHDTKEGLITLRTQLYDILSSSGFIMTQWKSNDTDILITRGQQECFHISNNETVKTLGVLWNPNQDIFQFTANIRIESEKLTKRMVLSIIGQVFDPLGLIGPVIIKAKVILQQLWKMKIGWGEDIPFSHKNLFLNFFNDLKTVNKIHIPRHAVLSTYVHLQMHGFSDASEMAYGACVYLRCADSHGRVYTQLLCSKSRVAPLKVITLPRLELCGALLLARLVSKVLKAMQLNVNEKLFWTDSQIVLAWLSQEPSRWKTFVSNRVAEIQTLTNAGQWCHVRSKDNPADIISRGQNPSELVTTRLWWRGPSWLEQDVKLWPTMEDQLVVTIPDEKTTPTVACVSVESDTSFYQRYSNLQHLIRITAWCRRFANNCRDKYEDRIYKTLQVTELQDAMSALVKRIQQTEFCNEIKELTRKGSVSKGSKLSRLNPFVDDKGLLRVGGRLANSNLKRDQQFPMLLPDKHAFTQLVIRNEHEKTLHGGAQSTLASVRSRFWPINAMNNIKKVLRQCVTCFKARPTSFTPIMGQLPTARVIPSRPFHSTGIDFAGPFMVKDGTLRTSKLVKVYVCLFICFSTKAIHLEVTGDLTTVSFLNALKRFFARRGISKHIWSDNGLNLVGAANNLKKTSKRLLDHEKNQYIEGYLSENLVTWHFIPPRAPHFGGLWESAIKLFKQHLIRVLGKVNLTYENFYTVTTQIESILNSRPITPLSNDPSDLEALTPGHFLIGARLNSLPEETLDHLQPNRLSKYQLMQQIIQSFWKRWSQEYLHSLQQRKKWSHNKTNSVLKPGVMVIVREDNLAPSQWRLGRIVNVHPGSDNIVRVASVRTGDGVIKRAFSKLHILPINVSDPNVNLVDK